MREAYPNELYHHGILGQKWGVRRYQNADGSLTAVGRRRYGSLEKSESKAENSKGLAKQYHNYNAASKRAEIERANKVKNAKGIGNKFSEAFGYGAMATNRAGRAEYAAKNAEIAKTKLGKKYNEALAFNANSMKNYAEMMQKKSAGERFMESVIIKSNMMSVPVKRLSGRESTFGKEWILSMTTAGIGNTILDANYTHGKNQAARLDSKIQKTKDKKEFDVKSFDAITEDLKYKNGKTFYSVEDAKRDQKATAEAYDKKIEKLEKKRSKYN